MSQKCMGCGAVPGADGQLVHKDNCRIWGSGPRYAGLAGSLGGPAPDVEHGPLMGHGMKVRGVIEQRIREICQEEIAKHLEMAREIIKIQGSVDEARGAPGIEPKELQELREEVKKLRYNLELAKIALRKIAGADPRAAAQRAQMAMPAEHDIAKLTLREMEREDE